MSFGFVPTGMQKHSDVYAFANCGKQVLVLPGEGEF
jgi:hypothetical protein